MNNYPFTDFKNGICRPYLPLRIINPHTDKSYKTFGLITTGADECVIPAFIAKALGYRLHTLTHKPAITGSGKAVVYGNTTKLEIYHPISGKLLYTIPDTPADFLHNLPIVLLGINNLLSRFILTINYPKKFFSIKPAGIFKTS
ncbi:MAG: hypothetical protein HRF42_14845 [Candidatus Brocadia sp.]|jgi:hypothetical protein